MPPVAFFGPSGTFTEMALLTMLAERPAVLSGLPDNVDRVSLSSPGQVIEAVRAGDLEFGCVPMESSVEGAVPATMDALPVGAPVQIVAEAVLDIAFTVAAAGARAPGDVGTVCAYPVAAAQARESLERMFPAARIIPSASNAAAAADVAAGAGDVALTTALAADAHGLTRLADGVADRSDATTRFVLLARPMPVPPRTGDDRTSVILDLPNRPGALLAAMREFGDREIDLTRIESRPRRTERGYYFFLDAVGHVDDPAMTQALAGLHVHAKVVFLGSWPARRGNGAPPPDRSASLRWAHGLRAGRR